MRDEDIEVSISGRQLGEFSAAAESKSRRAQLSGEHSFARKVKKSKRSDTPPDEITSGDEARYMEQERRAAKRTADRDDDDTEAS
jgi:hypothetical protein